MQEQQNEDFYIPRFLLKMPLQPESSRREAQAEDFLKGVEGWSEYFSIDDCDE